MFEFQLPKKFKKLKIKGFKEEIEPQEIFLDSLAQKEEDGIRLSERKIEVPFSGNIPRLVYAVFLIIIAIFFCRIFQLQIIKGEELTLKSLENRLRIYQIKAERGVIYDVNLNQLVWNKPNFDLILDKKDFPKEKENAFKILKELSGIIESVSAEEMEKKIEESEGPLVLIYENLSHSNLVSLEAKLKNGEKFPGVKIKENISRQYVKEPNLSHLIGYMGKINSDELKIFKDYYFADNIGKTGIEKFYEELLRGKPGEFQVEIDARGRMVKESTKSQAESGKSLVLWMDLGLQSKIETELKKALQAVGAEKAAAVALNPQNGGVLALVSLPDFDNNQFSQGISREELDKIQKNSLNPLFNKAIGGIGYPTGSVIKPLIALAALEEGIINENTKIYCPAQICVWNSYAGEDECYKDWTFPEAHGTSDIKRAIAESINPFFYIIGGGYKDFKGLGAKKIKEYLKLFNLGERTGINLPQEGKGILPEVDKNWYLGDTYHLSIGQGPFTATPIEVTAAFGAIANGGTLYQPQVIKEIIDGETVRGIEPSIIRENFLDPQNIQIVKEGMREGVIYGSSVALQDLPVKTAAKTGTAQTGENERYHHWVTVFAPYEDPQIVLTIVIEDVKGLQRATLPVVTEVLKWYFQK